MHMPLSECVSIPDVFACFLAELAFSEASKGSLYGVPATDNVATSSTNHQQTLSMRDWYHFDVAASCEKHMYSDAHDRPRVLTDPSTNQQRYSFHDKKIS